MTTYHPKFALGLKHKLHSNQSQYEEKDQNQEKRSKLTLGLKKKAQDNHQPQENFQNNTEKRSKLTLGLRKKPALVHPQFAGETPTSFERGSNSKQSVGYQARKRPEFHPNYIEKPRVLAPRQSTLKIPKTQGKLEVNIKISELPNWVETIKRGWQRFCINADGQIVQMVVRPRVWNKLLQANQEYQMWVANITGKMGPRIKDGFVLLEPAIQVYEKLTQKPESKTSEEVVQ